jgi:hypothetical protein
MKLSNSTILLTRNIKSPDSFLVYLALMIFDDILFLSHYSSDTEAINKIINDHKFLLRNKKIDIKEYNMLGDTVELIENSKCGFIVYLSPSVGNISDVYKYNKKIITVFEDTSFRDLHSIAKDLKSNYNKKIDIYNCVKNLQTEDVGISKAFNNKIFSYKELYRNFTIIESIFK